MTNLKHYIGYGVAILLLALFLVKGQEEREGRIKAEGQIHEQQSLQAARDQAQKDKNEAIDKVIAGLTPETAIPVLQGSISKQGGIKKASQEPLKTVLGSQLPQSITEGVPDAPGAKFTVLTPFQTTLLGQRELSCQEVEGNYSTCKADLGGKDKEINDLQTALKGGTKFTRLKKAVKCLAVSGLAAGGGAFFDKSHPAQGAAIGAVLGGAGCQVFF